MTEETEDDSYARPLWARFSFWVFLGVFIATLGFTYQNRDQVLARVREYLTVRQAPPAAQEDEGPALKLSAPVDPAKNFSKVSADARVSSSARGRRMMRDVRGRGRPSAGDVGEVRQLMSAPDVSGETEISFWETDLGLGILMSLSISFCFFVAGSILFRNRDSHGKKVT